MSSAAEPQARIHAYDYVRALSLMMVVLFHVIIGIQDSSVPISPLAITINESLRTVRMPMFFFASGALFHIVFEKRKSGFWRSLFLGLIIPYVVWSLVQGSGKIFMAGFTTNAVKLEDLLHILWAPINHFWFIYSLVVLRIVLRVDRGRGLILYLTFCASILYWSLSKLGYLPIEIRSVLLIGTARGAVYFCAGLWFIRRYDIGLFKIAGPMWTVAVLVGVVLFALFRYLEWTYMAAMWPLLAIFFEIVVEPAIGIATILIFMSRFPAPRGPIGSIVSVIAQGSLVIYMIHPMIAAISRSLLIRSGIYNWAVLVPLVMIIATSVPIFIYSIARRYRILPYLALGPNRSLPKQR